MDEEQIILMLREMRTDIKGIKSEMQDMKAEMQDIKSEMNTKFDNMQMDLNIVRSAVINIEQTHGPLLKAMVDAQVVYEEKHNTHEPRIIRLEDITKKHDIKISHLLHQA